MNDDNKIPKIDISGIHTASNDDDFNYDYSSSPQKVHYLSEEKTVNQPYTLPNFNVVEDEAAVKRKQDMMYLAGALAVVVIGVAAVVIFNIFSSMKLTYGVKYIPETITEGTLFLQFNEDGTCYFDEFGLTECNYENKLGNVVVNINLLGYERRMYFRINNQKTLTLYRVTYTNNYMDYMDKKVNGDLEDKIKFVSNGESFKPKNETTTKKTTYRNTSSNNENVKHTTKVYSSTVSKLEVKEYDKYSHYAKVFFLHEGDLYAHIDDSGVDILIMDNVAGGILEVIDPDTFDSYLFAENRAGEIFYLNNYVHSSLGMFDLIPVPNVMGVKRGKYIDGKFTFITYDDITISDVEIDTGL